MSDNNTTEDEAEYEVDRIVGDKTEGGEKHYLVRWKNYGSNDDTWEPVSNLDCPDIISNYEANKVKKPKKETKTAKKEPKGEPPKKKKREDDSGPRGFERNLKPEKILGATDESGQLQFLMKWENAEIADLVPAKEANVKCPQIVISFYEERLTWHSSSAQE